MGGANIPALNRLLNTQNIALGDRIVDGEVRVGNGLTVRLASSATLTKVPKGALVWIVGQPLTDQSAHVLMEEQRLSNNSNKRYLHGCISRLTSSAHAQHEQLLQCHTQCADNC